jgi:hypothetical protein
MGGPRGRHPGNVLSLAPPRFSFGITFRRLLDLLDRVSANEVVDHPEWFADRWEPPDS